MKQTWLRYSEKIDALGLRERVVIFLMLVLIMVAMFDTLLLEPQFARETELSRQINQDQSQIAGIQAEIQGKIASYDKNPDATKQARLAALVQKSGQMRSALQDMQKGLVSPDKMSTLLEDILRRNGKLHLVALHTLPVSGLNDPEPVAGAADGKAGADAGSTALLDKSGGAVRAINDAKDEAQAESKLVYKHGVEMVIEGNYLDMVDYMTSLEGMPWQLFWGKAKLIADDSGKLKLTLTLYTLSLEKNWLKI
ncbi:MAG TPA: MSHA biogenesis protein MshJ [Burkholderiaceae bacterium]